MTQTVDVLVPIAAVFRRYQGYQDGLRAELNALPWWRFGARSRLVGAIAAYQFEIDAILGLAASRQPIIGDRVDA